MANGYWLARNRASLESARNAVSAEARLIHYDLAGRYSLKALLAERQGIDLPHLLIAAVRPRAQNMVGEEACDA